MTTEKEAVELAATAGKEFSHVENGTCTYVGIATDEDYAEYACVWEITEEDNDMILDICDQNAIDWADKLVSVTRFLDEVVVYER